MKRLVPVFLMMLLLFGAGSAAAITDLDAYNMLNPASQTYNPNAYLIDVRTVSEWASGHPGSDPNNSQYPGLFLESPTQKVFNVPIYSQLPRIPANLNPLFDAAIQYLFPDKANDILIFMCGSGARSGKASAEASLLGYTNVDDLGSGGSYSHWAYIYDDQGNITNQLFLPTTTDTNGNYAGTAAAMPLPPALLLFGSGLVGLTALRRRFRR